MEEDELCTKPKRQKTIPHPGSTSVKENRSPFDSLPNELLQYIASKLPHAYIITMVAVCRRFRDQVCQSLRKLDSSFRHMLDNKLRMLQHCTNLVSLDLSDTFISTKAIKELRHCPQLTELNLFARRNLTASNLHQIAIYCPNLQRLDLSFSTSSSFSALTMLTNITDLTLCETRIGDSDVQILQTLSNLTRLDVEATCLSGTGLTELLMKLTKLRHLNASNLYFDQQSRKGDFLALCTSLVWLSLERISLLMPSAYENLGLCTNLKFLDLSFTHTQDQHLELFIPALTGLESLTLAGTFITDEGLKLIGTHAHCLRTLMITLNPVSDVGAAYLSSISTLNTLYASGTEMTQQGVRQYLSHQKNLTVAVNYKPFEL